MNDTEVREFYTAYIEALNAHDFDSMDKFIADEIAFGTQVFARGQIVDILKSITDAVPDFQWEVTEILVSGDRAAVRLIDTGTPVKEWSGAAPTGASFSIPEHAIYRVEGGRFVEMLNVFDNAEIARQLNSN